MYYLKQKIVPRKKLKIFSDSTVGCIFYDYTLPSVLIAFKVDNKLSFYNESFEFLYIFIQYFTILLHFSNDIYYKNNTAYSYLLYTCSVVFCL